MTSMVGIALEHDVLRAAYRTRGRTTVVEIPWDPTRPEQAIELLRAQIPNPRAIALSIGLGFLEIARPELPPLANDARQRLLRRDADRYFPIEGAAAVSDTASGGVAFAVSSQQLQRWITAFEQLAPVRAVVAAPIGIVNALRARGTQSGTFTVDAGSNERGLMRFDGDTLQETRRVPLSAAAGVLNGTRPIDDRQLGDAPGRFAAALGVMDAGRGALHEMLLDATLDARYRAARTQRTWLSYALCTAMLVALGAAVNTRRDNTLQATQRAVDSLTTLAGPGVFAQAQLEVVSNEARILSANARAHSTALGVLATLSRALPADVFVQRLDWDGTEWHLDGSANQAATIVPKLDATNQFQNVRALGASTRFRDGKPHA